MERLSTPIVVILLCFVAPMTSSVVRSVPSCDLSYTCDEGVFHIYNQDPWTYPDARAEGCEIHLSVWNIEITIWNCQQPDVDLELITADGDSQSCHLSCNTSDASLSRRRRAEGDVRPLNFVLQAQGSNGKANYHCHFTGSVFIINPRFELYYHSVALSLSDNSMCSTRHALNNRIIEVYDCDTAGGLLFAMGSRSTVSFSINRQSNTLILNCGEVPEPVDNGGSGGAKYECVEDGSVTVTNPRKELFRYAEATSVSDGSDCQAVYADNYKKIIIPNCTNSGPFFLVLSRDPITETLIIRPNNVFLISCT